MTPTNIDAKFRRAMIHITTLIHSTEIEKYVVGITATPVRRRYAYEREEFDLFFVIDQELTMNAALELEERCFAEIAESFDSSIYDKYHPEKRNTRYRRSAGGRNFEGPCYQLYIAGWRQSNCDG